MAKALISPPRRDWAAVCTTSTVEGPGLATASRWTTASPSRATTTSTLERLAAARHGDDTGAADIDQPERFHQADEGLDLVRGAGDLEDEGIGLGVDHLGAEHVGQAQRLDPLLAGTLDLDQRQFALDVRALDRQITDLV